MCRKLYICKSNLHFGNYKNILCIILCNAEVFHSDLKFESPNYKVLQMCHFVCALVPNNLDDKIGEVIDNNCSNSKLVTIYYSITSNYTVYACIHDQVIANCLVNECTVQSIQVVFLQWYRPHQNITSVRCPHLCSVVVLC